MTPVLPEETKTCMRNLGERLKGIKGLRSVTLAIRTAPSKRSQAFAVAKAYILELGGKSNTQTKTFLLFFHHSKMLKQ